MSSKYIENHRYFCQQNRVERHCKQLYQRKNEPNKWREVLSQLSSVKITEPIKRKPIHSNDHNIGFLVQHCCKQWSCIDKQQKMRFPRGTALKLPMKKFSKSKFDAEKLSFFIVIAFFSIFAIIVLVELYFKERKYEQTGI